MESILFETAAIESEFWGLFLYWFAHENKSNAESFPRKVFESHKDKNNYKDII